MVKKTKSNQSDITIFRDAIKGVKPLIHNKTILKPAKRPPFRESEIYLNESVTVEEVTGEAFISYKQAGISNKTLRKLEKGQYNVDAILDLHGITTSEAKMAVISFIRQCVQRDVQVGLIIHGKGLHDQKPILKNMLNQWLREIDIVLAFCSAAHGNRGAMSVLFKRTKGENFV